MLLLHRQAAESQDNASSSVTFVGTPTGPVQWQTGIGGDGFYSRIDPVGTGSSLRFFQGNNSGGMYRCVSNCTIRMRPWSSVTGPWSGDTQIVRHAIRSFSRRRPRRRRLSAGRRSGRLRSSHCSTTRVWETIARWKRHNEFGQLVHNEQPRLPKT